MNVRHWHGSTQTLQDGWCEMAMFSDRSCKEGVQ
jgi:hypothetical protein